jgi:hypothetical protein
MANTIVRFIGASALAVAFSALVALVLIEWAVGCGEITYHADGTWVTNECVFIPHKQARGEW